MTDTQERVQHTPGPWKIVKRGNQIGLRTLFVTDEQNRQRLFDAGRLGSRNISETDEANARLIAAAPELLEALKHVQASLIPVKVRQGESRMDAAIRWGVERTAANAQARAAIAKAEGRS